MNKVLLVGRFVRDPETSTTPSGIKYARFTLAVDRQFADKQTDFVPVVAWRNQADFVDRFMRKGDLASVDGRFTSSTYVNGDNQKVTRYEVTADNVSGLETRSQIDVRRAASPRGEAVSADHGAPAGPMQFAGEAASPAPTVGSADNLGGSKDAADTNDVPWEIDL